MIPSLSENKPPFIEEEELGTSSFRLRLRIFQPAADAQFDAFNLNLMPEGSVKCQRPSESGWNPSRCSMLFCNNEARLKGSCPSCSLPAANRGASSKMTEQSHEETTR